ncbi:MAG: hypothetical protein RLO17_04705 [Cyclobacteriaceae bacterium]
MINPDSLSVQSTPVIIRDTVFVRDTVFTIVKETPKEMLDYLSILEKTNQQLDYWWSPIGIWVTAMGVLFTILAIAAAVVIFLQSREYRNRLKASIQKFEKNLEEIMLEKNTQAEMIISSLEERKLEVERSQDFTDEEKSEILKSIEYQKDILSPTRKIFKHAGWTHKDIPISVPITEQTIFEASILTAEPGQKFAIYLKVQSIEGSYYWMGFSTGDKEDYKRVNEYTIHDVYTRNTIIITRNILQHFREGFPESNETPIRAATIRLRGSDTNLSEVSFSYHFVNKSIHTMEDDE